MNPKDKPVLWLIPVFTWAELNKLETTEAIIVEVKKRNARKRMLQRTAQLRN